MVFSDRRLTEGAEHPVGDLLDAGLHARAHVVGLAHLAVGEHPLHRPAVVEDVDPLTAVRGRGVQGQGLVIEGQGREERDDLLRELVGPVVVGAVGDGHRQPVGLVVGAHGVVGPRLGGVVRRAGPVGRLLVEGLVGVEVEVAVDLAGGDVVKAPDADPPARLEQRLGPEHVGAEEQARVDDRQAVVGLGREVDHDVHRVLAERLLGQRPGRRCRRGRRRSGLRCRPGWPGCRRRSGRRRR